MKPEDTEDDSSNGKYSNDTNHEHEESLEEDTHQTNEGDRSPEYFRGKRIYYKSDTIIDKTPKIFACKDCRFVTKMKFNLARHTKQVHEGVRDKPCPFCNHSSKDNGSLKKHIKSKHETL